MARTTRSSTRSVAVAIALAEAEKEPERRISKRAQKVSEAKRQRQELERLAEQIEIEKELALERKHKRKREEQRLSAKVAVQQEKLQKKQKQCKAAASSKQPSNTSKLESIKIGTVTLADIRRGSGGGGSGLFRVPSKAERDKVYEKTADAISKLEIAQIPPHGGRPWKCRVTVKESCSKKKGKAAKLSKQGPLFRWYRGQLELACMPNIIEQIPDTKWGRLLDDDDLGINTNSLEARKSSLLSEAAMEDPNQPTIDRVWVSPLHETFRTRKSAMENAEKLADRDKLIDKVVCGYGAKGVLLRPSKPSRKQALEAGLYKFHRDGLWVVGQEESWQEDNLCEINRREALGLNPSTGEKKVEYRYYRPVEEFTLSKRDELRNFRLAKMGEHGIPTKEQKYQYKDAHKELRQIWRDMSDADKDVWRADKTGYALPIEGMYSAVAVASCATPAMTAVSDASSTDSSVPCSAPPKIMSNPFQSINLKSFVSPDQETTKQKKISKHNPAADVGRTCKIFHVETDSWYQGECTGYNVETGKHTINYTKTIVEEVNLKECKVMWDDARIIAESSHWRLKNSEISLCYDAIMDHYAQVMHTVSARGLQYELADGFDVLRERGRGRYDMEVPAFSESQFEFLTSPDAPWTEVVKNILGDEYSLVHKGAFLSLPGAAAQIYHQDGPHLTDRYQRPCHAVNVFLPLITLTMKHGPTEFCIGTHILGNEDYDKDLIETPLSRAGTPIIFDYRVGHRGMANTSDDPRPYVYLTYAAKSFNWKDDVNFSRKRYRKIGELVNMPMTREERQRKRKEQQYERLKVECRVESAKAAEERNESLKIEGKGDATSPTSLDGAKVPSDLETSSTVAGAQTQVVQPSMCDRAAQQDYFAPQSVHEGVAVESSLSFTAQMQARKPCTAPEKSQNSAAIAAPQNYNLLPQAVDMQNNS